MNHTPMTKKEIAALNAAYEALVAEDAEDAAFFGREPESTHILTRKAALNANLEVVKHYDQSGILYRNHVGRYVFGWESGGFDDQIEDND